MKRGGMFAPLATVALIALLAADSGARSTAAAMPERLWVIGDSIGVGIEGAIFRASRSTRRASQNSTNTRQWLARLKAPDFSWPKNPHTVAISLGTNDAQSAELRKEFDANARAIVELLRARGHSVIWVLPPSESSLIPSSVNLERLLALDIAVLQMRVPMADAWHPTAAGYDALVEGILKIAGHK